MRQIIVIALLGNGLTLAAACAAEPLPEARLLVPHRAIYNVVLDDSKPAEGISAVSGRLVFEFTGSVCEGFTNNLRMVMDIANREGNTIVSDFRNSAWEAGDGSRFRFSTTGFDNDQPSEQATGDAERGVKDVTIRLQKPAAKTITIDPSVAFPIQHTIAVLAAARAGKSIVSTQLYDGSEKGDRVLFASAAIGESLTPAAIAELPVARKLPQAVAGQRVWPVTIAYFISGEGGEGAPVQELSARMIENGVLDEIRIDYGTVAIKSSLTDLTLYPVSKCP